MYSVWVCKLGPSVFVNKVLVRRCGDHKEEGTDKCT
jgi:hypothetical protein